MTDAQDKFIIFLHIQKTGGITIQRILRRRLGKSVIERGINLLKGKNNPSSLKQLMQNKVYGDRYFIGHFCYGIHEYLPTPATYMSFFREPVSRLISLYNFSKINPTAYWHPFAVDKTLEEFLLGVDLPELDNGQVRFLVGENFANCDETEEFFINKTPVGQCDESLLDLAKKHIDEEFSFIGLTEYFDQSVLLLKEILGWKNSYYLRRNVTKKTKKEPVSAEVKQAIRDRNHLDIQLYDYVKEKLFQELRAYGLDDPKVLEEFQKNNKNFNQYFGPVYSVYDGMKSIARGKWGRPG